MTKKQKRMTGLEEMPFAQALEQLVRVDPKDVQSEIDKTEIERQEAKRGAKEVEESIERGARRTKHRFRL